MSDKTPAQIAAEARRTDHLRALQEERDGLARAGKTDRVAAIDAEIKAAKAEGSMSPVPTEATPAPAPTTDRADSKPKARRWGSKG